MQSDSSNCDSREALIAPEIGLFHEIGLSSPYPQEQSAEALCKKGVYRNFAKFTGKHQILWRTFLKKRLWHGGFPVNFAEFRRTPFLTEQLR